MKLFQEIKPFLDILNFPYAVFKAIQYKDVVSDFEIMVANSRFTEKVGHDVTGRMISEMNFSSKEQLHRILKKSAEEKTTKQITIKVGENDPFFGLRVLTQPQDGVLV